MRCCVQFGLIQVAIGWKWQFDRLQLGVTKTFKLVYVGCISEKPGQLIIKRVFCNYHELDT